MKEIDYSQLQTYITCPRRYKYKYLECLKKIAYDERDVDRKFGQCIHKGLELYYKHDDMKAGLQHFKDHFPDLEGEKVKTKANGLRVLAGWVPYSNTVFKDWEPLGSEVQNTYDLTEQLKWLVKIDLIVRWRDNIYAVDFKTTKTLGSTYFYKFDPHMQVSGYSEYVRQKYGQCSGMIIVAIKLGHRSRAYRGEPAGFHYNFEYSIINRSPQQLDAFRENAIEWEKRLGKDPVFPKNEGACHQFKGCSFKELCISCDDEQIKEQLYERVNDPLEYLKEDSK